MKGLVLYVFLVTAGALAAGFIGLWIENTYSSGLALIVFLSMFFANFVICWIVTILVMDGTLKRAQG